MKNRYLNVLQVVCQATTINPAGVLTRGLNKDPEKEESLQGAKYKLNYFFDRLKPESRTLTPTAIRINGHR